MILETPSRTGFFIVKSERPPPEAVLSGRSVKVIHQFCDPNLCRETPNDYIYLNCISNK
jgi:hypothetical protein